MVLKTTRLLTCSFLFKSFCFLFLVSLVSSSCGESSPLDRVFLLDHYNKDISLKLYNSDEIDQYDWFLLNYTIKRQKDVFGYEIKGKTYREILEMGREFKENGLPIPTTFNFNGETSELTQLVKKVDSGVVRKKENSKSLKKVLNFSCRYTNTSNKTIVLENSTFQVFGPFKDHVTSLGYEIYCPIRSQETITVNFLVDAKEIVNNLRFRENYYVNSMGIDDFIYSIDVRPSGNSVSDKTYSYTKCKFGSARLKPFKIWDYYKDVDPEKCIRRGDDRKIVEFQLGDAHYEINDAQDITNMKRIGRGNRE